MNYLSRRSFYKFTVQNDYLKRYTNNQSLQQWISERIKLFSPSRVHLCDGSDEEYQALLYKQIQQGTLIKLNRDLRPNSYLARSTVSDTARVEDATYICTESKTTVGPTNNWIDPQTMHSKMEKLFTNSMKGRTMYVVPFCMGQNDSEFSIYGVQVTDSPYVVCCMRIMTRMGQPILNELNTRRDAFWIPCVHSLGAPLLNSSIDESSWPCNPTEKHIVHFPEERRIWSYGSGYGGNAILGKKCLGLRLASFIAREENWLAEHSLIVGVTNPKGVKKYFLGCFPSACGKTNLAMLETTLSSMLGSSDWKVTCLGDDIAWIRYNEEDGRMYAVNPENGFFGVAPGTSNVTNINVMKTIERNTIFTNCAVTEENDVWWEGMTESIPDNLITWNRHEWTSDQSSAMAAHPNARFCVSIEQCPTLDDEYKNINGVPIDAIIFGGRRSTTVPLVFETRDWNHGVFVGSTMASETTAAAAGLRGVLRMDPFSMKPFCGYNMAEYFRHWLSFGKESKAKKKAVLPKVFHVNWFRKDRASNRIIWPGFAENIRVIKWIFERCEHKESANAGNYIETAIGKIPKYDDAKCFDISNLEGILKGKKDLDKLFKIDRREWLNETLMFEEFYKSFENRVPEELIQELKGLRQRLENIEE